MVTGLWGHALSTGYAIHFLHLAFIGGFSLFSILVATRVTLSHGGYGTDLERTSSALKWAALLISASAFVRLWAPMETSYVHHLAYAAILWISGLVVWSVVFIPKMARTA